MHYQEYTVTNHSSAVSRLADFAAAIGWTVADFSPPDGSGTTKHITAPASAFHPAPKTFQIASVDTLTAFPSITALLDATYSGSTYTGSKGVMKIDAPWNATVSAKINPTKVSLFGGTSPDYWLAMVLTYEYNLYRHLYIGHIEPIGGFTGGELLSGSQPFVGTGSIFDASYYNDPYNIFLFNARSTGNYRDLKGGALHVVHANAAAEWNTFDVRSGFSRDDAHPAGTACGGYGDGFNDGYAQRARSRQSGAAILVPQNLYITDNANGFVPVGRAAGVRLVDMLDLAPEQSLSVGDVPWHVFPAWSRNPSKTHDLRNGVRNESSQYIGYAYMENPS